MASSIRRVSTILQHVLRKETCEKLSLSFRSCSTVSNQPSTTQTPRIALEPRVALFDEKIRISLHNFPSNKKVTLHGEFVHGGNKVKFASLGHYITNDSGEVCLLEQPSSGGTYTGLEPMGILWSLKPAPGFPPHTRMTMRFTERPCVVRLLVYPGHLLLEDIYQTDNIPEHVAQVQVERYVKSADVTRVEIEAGNVRGALFLPPGDGPFQGVIDMFGSAGGIIEYRAALLASRGFAALSLPYFAYKDLPKLLSEITFDYFEEATKWFASHPKVMPGGVGVVGVSKGVEIAYTMSAYLDEISCAVLINGFPYYCMDDLYHKGKILCKATPMDISLGEFTEEGFTAGPIVPYTDNIIPAWRRDAKHLVLVSEDDYGCIVENHKLMIDTAPEEKKANFEVVRYPGAGHLLEPPYTAMSRSTINPQYNLLMLYGGQPKEHAHAQEDSWQRILQFLRKNIPSTH